MLLATRSIHTHTHSCRHTQTHTRARVIVTYLYRDTVSVDCVVIRVCVGWTSVAGGLTTFSQLFHIYTRLYYSSARLWFWSESKVLCVEGGNTESNLGAPLSVCAVRKRVFGSFIQPPKEEKKIINFFSLCAVRSINWKSCSCFSCKCALPIYPVCGCAMGMNRRDSTITKWRKSQKPQNIYELCSDCMQHAVWHDFYSNETIIMFHRSFAIITWKKLWRCAARRWNLTARCRYVN